MRRQYREEDYQAMTDLVQRAREPSLNYGPRRPGERSSVTIRSPTTGGRVPLHLPSPPAPTNPLPSPPMEPVHSYVDERLEVGASHPRVRPASETSSHSSNGYSPSQYNHRYSGGVSPLGLTPPETSSIPPAQPAPTVRRQTAEPTRYSFSQLSWNSMVVAPVGATGPERVQEAMYNISVSLNCFLPGTAFTTTIRRGGTPEGDFVAEIELGHPDHANRKERGGTVRVGNTKVWLNKALKKGAGNHKTSAFSWKSPWSWEFPGNTQLLWNCSDQLKKCHRVNYTGGRDITPLVATFNPPHTDDKDVVVVSSPAILEVAGVSDQETMDHIVLSVLLLERKRLLPSS